MSATSDRPASPEADHGATLPALRADVRLEIGADGTGALVDGALGRRIKLDVRGVAIARALATPDGARTPEAVSAAIETDAAGVSGFAARLVALDLCDTPRATARVAERQALARVKARPAAHLAVLSGARFGCTMCGSCCGGHNVGPVSQSVLDGLAAELPAFEREIAAARHVAKDLFVTLPPGERARPGVHVMCHASNGSCVFLDEAGRCRIHARLGGEAKPLPCRIFPWEIVATPTGVRVAVQRECRDFLAATGPEAPPLEAARDELAALVEAIGELPTARPIPKLRGRELDSWAVWESFEQQLSAALVASDARNPAATFAGLAACLGEAPAAETPGRFSDWRTRMLGPLGQMLAAAPAPSAKLWIRVDGLELAVNALEAATGWTLARALEPLSGEAVTLFREHLRHALWTCTPLRATSVEAGLARVHAEWVLARLVAIVRAREVKRFHVTSQDLQDGLVIASFLFRHDDLQPLLAELDALTTSVFVDGIAALSGEAAAATPDRRVELVKF